MANLLLEALMSQFGDEDFDTPILIVPSSMLGKKRKVKNESDDILETRLAKPSPTFQAGGVIPSPTPG